MNKPLDAQLRISDIPHFIGGREVAGTSGRHGDVYNPATGDIDIDWTGTTRRNYTIFYSSDMRSWQQAAPPLTGGTADFTLAGPALKRLFFRIGAGLPLQ